MFAEPFPGSYKLGIWALTIFCPDGLEEEEIRFSDPIIPLRGPKKLF